MQEAQDELRQLDAEERDLQERLKTARRQQTELRESAAESTVSPSSVESVVRIPLSKAKRGSASELFSWIFDGDREEDPANASSSNSPPVDAWGPSPTEKLLGQLDTLIEGAPELETWMAPRLASQVLQKGGFLVEKILELDGRVVLYRGRFREVDTTDPKELKEAIDRILDIHSASRYSKQNENGLQLLVLKEDAFLSDAIDEAQGLFRQEDMMFWNTVMGTPKLTWVAVSKSHRPGLKAASKDDEQSSRQLPEVPEKEDNEFSFTDTLRNVVSSPVVSAAFFFDFLSGSLSEGAQTKLFAGDLTAVASIALATGVFILPQLLHEAAHRAVEANKDRNIQQSNYRCMPSPVMYGFMGGFQDITSFPRNNQDIFLWAFWGPAAGILASLALLLLGAFQTFSTPPSGTEFFFNLPLDLINRSPFGSFLLSLPQDMMLLNVPKDATETAKDLALSPVAFAAYCALIVQSLQALPLTGTDGHIALQKAWGSAATAVTETGIFLLLIVSILSDTNHDLTWFIVLTTFVGNGPGRGAVFCEDNCSELSWIWKNAALLLMGTALLIVNPLA
eukprot:scaffold425_cov373-Pinguiococcus_pyrenoidosus.AAC.14